MELQKLIRDKEIYEYFDLMNYLIDEELFSFWEVASSHTYFSDKYISSLRNKRKSEIYNLKDQLYRKMIDIIFWLNYENFF